jgi:tetratricopeptide (TPR) repeat protein
MSPHATCPHCDAVIPAPPHGRGAICPGCGRRLTRARPARAGGIPVWAWLLAPALAACLVGALVLFGLTGDHPRGQEPETPDAVRTAQTRTPPPAPAPPAQPRQAPAPEPPEPPPAHPLGVPLVYLEPPDYLQQRPLDARAYNVLLRELARQALLIAARDGLGVATRDGALREELPDGLPAENRLHLDPVFRLGKPLAFTLGRGPAGSRRALWQREASPAVMLVPEDLTAVLEAAELMSRTSFLNALRRAGFDGKPRPAGAAGVPGEVEDLLAEMNFVSQYAALRRLHELARTGGESPRLTGALARGYAHLGVLTECHWSSAHKVFKARALLYAQRLAAAEPGSPWGLWHRAYATGLAGMHAAALKDLARAAELAGKAGTQPPAWVGLVEALCRFDTAWLQRPPSDPRLAQLAALLRYLTVESPAAVRLSLATAEEVLKAAPDCGRVHDGIAELGGVATRHRTTLSNMEAFGEMLPRRLAALPGLPSGAKEALDGGAPEPAVLGALVEAGRGAGEGGEPSWAVLGRLAEEGRFTQVCARLTFVRDMWAVPVDEELAAYLPLVRGHPYEAFVGSFALDPARKFPEYQMLLTRLELRDFDARQAGLYSALYRLGREHGTRAWQVATSTADQVYRDFVLILRSLPPEADSTGFSPALLQVSPHAPAARASLLRFRWDQFAERAAAWEKEAQQPEVLLALGRRYTELKRPGDAERCLRRAAELSPDYATSRALAALYKAQGKADQWLRTLEATLNEPDAGLDHAQARVEIARHFMAAKDFERARPYAEAAAETWAAWAMLCAAECYEGLGDWGGAELWVRRTSERYSAQAGAWFLWCHRTGRGNARAAAELVAQHLAALGERLAPEDRALAGTYHLLAGEPGKAPEQFEALYTSRRDDVAALLAALTYDRLSKPEGRDRLLQEFPSGSAYAPLVRLFREDLDRRKGGRLDPGAVDAVLAKLPPDQAPAGYYFVARFMAERGRKEAAGRYLQRCVAGYGTQNRIIAALAGAELRAGGPAAGAKPD